VCRGLCDCALSRGCVAGEKTQGECEGNSRRLLHVTSSNTQVDDFCGRIVAPGRQLRIQL
jgi:hypothetical protein